MVDYKSIFGYVPNITFTLEQHLKNYSEIEANARRLLESFHIIREKMEVNLRPVIALFPHYSEHSHEHSEHIISAIEKLLGRNRIEKLTPADTWMLLVCAYMHDLGMLVQGKELESDWKTPEFQEHIHNCMDSYDEELKKAASNVNSIDWAKDSVNWPVYVYRDVILLASEFYRRKHPERAKILPQRTELKQALNSVMSGDGKIPQRIQEVVGKICFSHGISFNEMLDFLEPTDSLLGYEFHPRFSAALLCLGDLCDLDNGRFNAMAIETFGGLAKSNLVHYYKHESVTSFVIQKDSIAVTFNIQNRKIKEELKRETAFANYANKDFQDFFDSILLETQNWINWLIDIVENIKSYWNDFCITDMEALTPALNYKILVEGKETISSKKNMRFSFSNEKAYELIEGYNLYNNNLIFIRELLQNSIDALKKQFWADILAGRWNHLLNHLENEGQIDYAKIQPFDFKETNVFDYYQVKIFVKHDEKDSFATFVIEDNGTGISKDDVEKRIMNTGIHDDLHDDTLNKMPKWLMPTSAFGIGLHSVFAVTDTLFVQTRTEFDNTVYNINMHSGKRDGYIFMSVAEEQDLRFCNCSHGTRMEFAVDVSKCHNNEEIRNRYDSDPLDERPESDFCRMLQNMLDNMMHVSMFHVTYKFNSDNEIMLNKLYQDMYMGLLFKENRRNNVFGEVQNNDYYDFALDIKGDHIVLWDRQRAILMVYTLHESTDYQCKVFCKGFKVENARIFCYGYNMKPDMVDYWGGNTKSILSVSRDKLSQEQIENNIGIFSQARDYMADIYYSVLNLLLEDIKIKEWHSDIIEFMKEWMEKKNDNIEMPNLSENFNNLVDKYSEFKCSKYILKHCILGHGFYLLLKSCKEQIQFVMNSLNQKDMIPYLYKCKLLEKDIDINKIIKEQTYFYEFVDKALQNYNIHIISLFKNIFFAEYADMYRECLELELELDLKFDRSFGISNVEVFGEAYNSEFIWISAQYREYSELEATGYIPRPLDFYLSVPLTRIIYLLICTNKNILSLKKNLISELSYIPGYNNGFGFIEVNNVGDIILSSQLRIEEEKYNQNIVMYLPFINWLSLKSIDINLDGKIILQFNNKYENKGAVEFHNKSFEKILYSYSFEKIIPIPVGYEDIAIDPKKSLDMFTYDGKQWYYSCYITYLWGYFSSIKGQYGSRIAKGEDKEIIINEIMPSSRTDNKPVINLLRYIYHNRAYNKDLKFEEAWERIYETYRRFVSMVLDCIHLDE